MSEKDELNRITQSIIGAAIEVHKNLGSGLLESAWFSLRFFSKSLCALSGKSVFSALFSLKYLCVLCALRGKNFFSAVKSLQE
jgi:hypothetical protein